MLRFPTVTCGHVVVPKMMMIVNDIVKVGNRTNKSDSCEETERINPILMEHQTDLVESGILSNNKWVFTAYAFSNYSLKKI